MEEKSAFDLLSELYNGQKALSTRMVNLEEALLLILKELREKEDLLKTIPEEKRKESFVMETPQEMPKVEEPKEKVAKNIRVVGKIKNDQDKGLGGVVVQIYDIRNNIIKTTKTNKAGQYFSFLPPGKYTAHYINEKPKIDKNINFEIELNDKEVRI